VRLPTLTALHIGIIRGRKTAEQAIAHTPTHTCTMRLYYSLIPLYLLLILLAIYRFLT
jgi:hypothetical protein